MTTHSATVVPFPATGRRRPAAEKRLCRDCLWCGGALADQCEVPHVWAATGCSRMPIERARRNDLVCGSNGNAWEGKP